MALFVTMKKRNLNVLPHKWLKCRLQSQRDPCGLGKLLPLRTGHVLPGRKGMVIALSSRQAWEWGFQSLG